MIFNYRNILLRGAVAFVLTLSAILCFGSQSISDDFTDRRVTAGTKIFRALLAADSAISEKKSDKGDLHLCLVYQNDKSNAILSANILQSRSKTDIRGINIDPEFVLSSKFVAQEYQDCAGVFLTEQFSDEKLGKLIEIVRNQQIVLFSPFEGEVERGVLGGIKVESRVLPYINVHALKESNIALKSFFMKIAKTYED